MYCFNLLIASSSSSLSSEKRAILIAFQNGDAISKVSDSEVGISPTASLKKFAISDVPMDLSSEGIIIIFNDPFSLLCEVDGVH